MTKLNIGCGTEHLPDFVNMDCDPSVQPDVVVSPGEPLPFDDESVSLILVKHVIEHIQPSDVSDSCRDWHRVLRVSGRLELSTPDMPGILAKGVGTFLATHDIDGQLFYGTLGFVDRGDALRHSALYTPFNLSELLARSDFWVRRVESGKAVSACGEEPISLVCHAEKQPSGTLTSALSREVKALLTFDADLPDEYLTELVGYGVFSPFDLMARGLSRTIKQRLLAVALDGDCPQQRRVRVLRALCHKDLAEFSDSERDSIMARLLDLLSSEPGSAEDTVELLHRYVRAVPTSHLDQVAAFVAQRLRDGSLHAVRSAYRVLFSATREQQGNLLDALTEASAPGCLPGRADLRALIDLFGQRA